VKGFVKPSSSMKGFLRQGFLNPSLAVKASTSHTSLLEMGVSSLTPEVKEVGVGRDSLRHGWLRHSNCWKG
jgi:hypothetical protein